MHEWIFSGIGTAAITGIISFFVGCGTGYYVGQHNLKQKTRQKQKAGDNSSMSQVGNIVINNGTK